jgi:hypothetical protein
LSDLFALLEGLPSRIGRYEASHQLGSGGFGFVLRAFDPVLKRDCALKLPLPGVLDSPERRQRFVADGRALARLDHPNVVRVYDSDEYGRICYIAMEFCEAGSLAEWLRKLPERAAIPIHWTINLVAQIADGVQHAHRRGVYHRDLKPANILLAPAQDAVTGEASAHASAPDFPRFCPKVGDFGLAKILGDEELTVVPAMLGTKPYMAPEQIRCDSAAVGAVSDVWALGVILYELLTRRRPFPGPDEEAFRRQICEQDPATLRRLRPGIPKRLETVCLKCLERNRSERYQNPSELANDLRRVLENLDPLGRRAPLWKRTFRRLRKHPIAAALASAALVSVLIAAWMWTFVRQTRIEGLFHEVKSATIADLPGLVPRLADLGDSSVIDRLRLLVEFGRDVPRLAAAIVLAKQRPDCGQLCCDWLLEAKPEEFGPVARLLEARVPGLRERLVAAMVRVPTPNDSDKEKSDRRRASAACALALITSDERPWALLRFDPDPQRRSFLLHLLGPAGVEPARLFARLQNPKTENSARIALIQSLGLVPDSAWNATIKACVTRWLIDRYQNDPSAGIHGSTKWLLRRWKHDSEMEQIDCALSCAGRTTPGFQWRVSHEGLTLITVDDPALDRVIEVSDTEVTVKMYLRFNPKFTYFEAISPTAACPINGISYYEAAAFCNWLSSLEGLSADQACYKRSGTDRQFTELPQDIYLPLPGHCDRAGFRLPTSEEFDVYCPAGTRTRRYHGDSDFLFDRYAWTLFSAGPLAQAHPVASLLPNELGLFDTLGNLCEWCDATRSRTADGQFVADLRGGFYNFSPPSNVDRSATARSVPGAYNGCGKDGTQGFRVVRTVRGRAKS